MAIPVIVTMIRMQPNIDHANRGYDRMSACADGLGVSVGSTIGRSNITGLYRK